MNKIRLKLMASIIITVGVNGAVAAPVTSSAEDDVMLQYYKENEKYACTPEELADFLKSRRK